VGEHGAERRGRQGMPGLVAARAFEGGGPAGWRPAAAGVGREKKLNLG
jgi:hypothetical protein